MQIQQLVLSSSGASFLSSLTTFGARLGGAFFNDVLGLRARFLLVGEAVAAAGAEPGGGGFKSGARLFLDLVVTPSRAPAAWPRVLRATELSCVLVAAARAIDDER